MQSKVSLPPVPSASSIANHINYGAATNSNSGFDSDQTNQLVYTAVGYVGLHLVLRPMSRWAFRSLLLPAKPYVYPVQPEKAKEIVIDASNDTIRITNTTTTANAANNINPLNPINTINPNVPNTNLTNLNNPNTTIVDPNANLQTTDANLTTNGTINAAALNPALVDNGLNDLLRQKTLLSERTTGICGSYAETIATFGSLTLISYTCDPRMILLYFGVSYPSFPFVLRCLGTLNDRKASLTFRRIANQTCKAGVVTLGFAVSMFFGGSTLQTMPFANVVCLGFWDALADCILSDGPSQ